MSNKYLEKIAETYHVEPSKLDREYGGVKSLALNRHELMKLEDARDNNYRVSHALGSAAAGGAIGAYAGKQYGKIGRAVVGAGVLHKHGPNRFVDFANRSKGWKRTGRNIGAIVGGALALRAYDNHVREKSLKDAGFSAYQHNLDRLQKK